VVLGHLGWEEEGLFLSSLLCESDHCWPVSYEKISTLSLYVMKAMQIGVNGMIMMVTGCNYFDDHFFALFYFEGEHTAVRIVCHIVHIGIFFIGLTDI
jgi:hypothetical protein